MRILCVQLADIGDLVLTTPALKALREAQPHAYIALLTTPHAAPIIPDGLVDNLIHFEKHTFDNPRALANPANWQVLFNLRRQLDMGVFDTTIFFHHFSTRFGALKFMGLALAAGSRYRIGLQGPNAPFLNGGIPDEGFGAQHQAQYWLGLVRTVTGQKADDVPAVVAQAPFSISNMAPSKPRIAIHAGSGGYSMARRWDPIWFAALADRLHTEQNASLVFVGGPDDQTAAVINAMKSSAIDLTGQTSLPELASVLEQADLFIGADSGVMHIAAAVGTPVVSIFGPSNHRAWGPWTPTTPHTIVRSAPLCSPCSYVGTGIGLRDGCAARTCMRMVGVEQVYEAAMALLSEDNPPPVRETPPKLPRNRVNILGVPVDRLSYESWLAQIDVWVRTGTRLHHMCTVNPEFVMIAQRDPNFRHILQRADLCLADGIGLIYASRYLGHPLPGRVTGSDGVPMLAERAAETGWRLFFLGAADGIAEQAANELRGRYPGVQIVGTFSGSPSAADEDAIVERINATNADILLVAYGAPQQDKWIARNAPRLNVRVAMGVGGTFDYIAGMIPMAPQPMRDAGLEWLFRLYKQPWRIRRQLRLPAFVLSVLARGREHAVAD